MTSGFHTAVEESRHKRQNFVQIRTKKAVPLAKRLLKTLMCMSKPSIVL